MPTGRATAWRRRCGRRIPGWALQVAKRIRAGQIDINGASFNALAPFGGFKQSGYGREFGVFGLEEYLEPLSIQLGA